MTDYNDGKWHINAGTECPVHPQSLIDIILEGGIRREKTALSWQWDSEVNPIIAFRVIKQHREPREVWIEQDPSGGGAHYLHLTPTPGASLFREVVE